MSNGLEQFGKELRSYLKTVPKLLGRAVVQESADNFRRQGYENDSGSVVPWEPRKQVDMKPGRKRKDGKRGPRVPNPRQRAILIKTGKLRRSVRIVATTANSVTIGSTQDYAQAQQEGLEHLPARPFITVGKSVKSKITRTITKDITKLLTK
ncbi:phage virion morphogenesis protein [Hymenobacter sp. ASUV-10]|uniref:Phage virion morphogenesis protein n=1 Tax=Hymenobacter aranciens TaxID=3063996 RepID=A0ABT9BGH3_9BACT|nr:phage virion morphogenesis protein [Hymenobacter sp. ASUV-10]MDO7877365.1 phage virion morphogenesis protein [Hymenobacter sp. ASUV-10]